jgi:hypothetical protein
MRDFNEWVIINNWKKTGLLGHANGGRVWDDERMEECALALEGQRST